MAKGKVKPLGHRNPEAFWQWFTANEAAIASIRRGNVSMLAVIHGQLSAYCPGLDFMFSLEQRDPREFVVCVATDRKLFAVAQQLIVAAPNLPHWIFVALRPSRKLREVICRSGRKLYPQEVWFRTIANGRVQDLVIAVKGLSAENLEDMAEGVFSMLDSLSGEYILPIKIGKISWTALSEDPKAEGLKPIETFTDLML